MNLDEKTIRIAAPSEKARQKELHRRKLLGAKIDFVTGDETLDELAARYQVPKGDLTRKSRREGWPSLRADKRAELEKRAVQRTYQHIGHRQVAFIETTAKMLETLEVLINEEMTRIRGDEPDRFGNKPTSADVHRVAKTIKTFVDAGCALYKLDKPVPIEPPAEADFNGQIVDVEPLSDPPQQDPLMLELPT
jgi:hypothetical protein